MESTSKRLSDTLTTHRWVWLLFAAIVVGIGYLFSRAHAVKEEPGKVPLSIAAEGLNIGDQWETKEFHWTLPIKNTSTSDVNVAKFLSECPCMTFDPPSVTLSPGQEVEVRVTCDMTAKCGQNRDLPIRDYAMPITPANENGLAIQPAWVLHGRIRSAIKLEPRSLNFWDSLVRGQPVSTRKVTVTEFTSVHRLEATCEPDLATAHLTRSPNDSAKYELVVQPRNDLKAGAFKFNVVLRPYTSEGSLPSVALPVEGCVLEDIQATPSLIQFGACPVGKPVHETVVLRSWSKEKFEVQRVSCDLPDISVQLIKSETGVNEYRIIHRVAHGGKQSSTIRFQVRPLHAETVVVSVSVNCLGIVK